MNYESTLTTNDIEHALNDWAEAEGEGEVYSPCLTNWHLDEDQLEIIKEACAVPHAAASIAHAMWCIADGEGLSSIAEVLRTH